MDDMEEWVREYSTKTGMQYEEIVERALEVYKESIDKVTPKENSKMICEVIEKSDEKEVYLKSIKNLKPDLMNIILSEKTYILKMLKNKLTYAAAIISFEECKKNFQQYAFIHYVNFLENKYKKFYPNIEKEIIKIVKKNKINNIDRIINGDYIEQFKSIGYKELYKNYSIKLNIENNRLRGISEYDKNAKDHVSSKCIPIFKMCPKRFNEIEDPNGLYKFSTTYGKFYAKINIKNDRCYARLYLDENKMNRMTYLKSVYCTFINDLYKNGVKIIYTLVGEQHINILKGSCDVTTIKEWIWIRKLL